MLYQRAHRSSCQRLVAVGGVMHSLLALPDDGSALDEAAVDVLCFGDAARRPRESGAARRRSAARATPREPRPTAAGCTCWAAGTVRKMGER